MKPILTIQSGLLTIHRLPPDQSIPDMVFKEPFYCITKTSEELSIVCSAGVPIPSESSDLGWACIKALGPLDFSLIGILADISQILAQAGISIFALSTYDTDYILVKSESLPTAQLALQQSGYQFRP